MICLHFSISAIAGKPMGVHLQNEMGVTVYPKQVESLYTQNK